ncbi:hypothetical protein [Gordonia otitidis]|uniref:Secreted protein n=1 Tax=Gordonia otitidis (strain DSM 44809 / CCUG 52243 / JCM 12355 / NBRC 100426 / IFM 10032) TaxID=1108044 RepID=H5TPX2_GORO1|nr:hypothetical protein [Gordonia otitidis]GAB35530.1 hypothetical protein GOOTI_169_00280 [Gordonia otitidis NBRC 100426]
MASKITRLRIAGASGALIGAGALAVALAAPASAAVTSVSVTTPSGYSSSSGTYGYGCSYTVSAEVSSDDVVVFSVSDGGKITPVNGGKPDAKTHIATAVWKPSAKGEVTISASQGGSPAKEAKANVGGRGIQLPNLPFLTTAATNGTCLVL